MVNYHKSNIKVQVIDQGDCDSDVNNCRQMSMAIFTLEIIGCGSAAAGVGGATFGLGGVVIYSICSGAALSHYNSMNYECGSNYHNCIIGLLPTTRE